MAIALANLHDRNAIVKLMEIIDKNNNPIHTATAIWALGEIVKKPDEAMLDYMRELSPKDEATCRMGACVCKMANLSDLCQN